MARTKSPLAASICLVALACASKPPVEPSGFLGDYSGFELADDGTEALIYLRPGVDLAHYHRVIIDPVAIALRPEAAGRPVNPDELAALADYLRDALLIALRGAYPVVERPADDVLRLRVAITDVVPTRPALNTAGTLVLPMRAASAAKRAITGTDLFVGEVAIEAEVTDSLTNVRLLALVDRKAGDKFHLKEGTTTWGHVAKSFRTWAANFRIVLDRAHGR